MSKVFPIRNDAACVFKWGWNTFRLYNGKSSSCHRVEQDVITVENFHTFHNTPRKIQTRDPADAPGRRRHLRRHQIQQLFRRRRNHLNSFPVQTPAPLARANSSSVLPRYHAPAYLPREHETRSAPLQFGFPQAEGAFSKIIPSSKENTKNFLVQPGEGASRSAQKNGAKPPVSESFPNPRRRRCSQ